MPALEWNDTFTEEDIYGQDAPGVAAMFMRAFIERRNAIQFFSGGGIVDPKNVLDCSEPSSKLNAVGGSATFNSPIRDRPSGVYRTRNADGGLFPLGHWTYWDDHYNRHPQLPWHELNFGAVGLNESSIYEVDGADLTRPFSWGRLQYQTWLLRSFFCTPGDAAGSIPVGLLDTIPFPGPHGYTRKFYREIMRLDYPGEEGQIARFIDLRQSPLPASYPDPLFNPNFPVLAHKADSTPVDQRTYAGKFFRYTDGEWLEWSEQDDPPPVPDEPDVVDDRKGFARGGDLFGPWILNEIRDALNLMTVTKGGGVSGLNAFSSFTPLAAYVAAEDRIRLSTSFGNAASRGMKRRLEFYRERTPGVLTQLEADDDVTDFDFTSPTPRLNSFDNYPDLCLAHWDVDGGFQFTSDT